MKFTSGLIIGAAVGGYLLYNMTPEQRDNVAARASSTVDKVKSSSAAQSITNNVSDVAGAASDRVADVVDTAGSKASDAVAPDSTPTTTI